MDGPQLDLPLPIVSCVDFALIEPESVFNARCVRRLVTAAPKASSKPGAASSLPVRLEPIDQQIVALLGQSGRYGLAAWTLLDQVAASQNPFSRSERRRLRLAAWQRLSRLVRKGMVHWLNRKSVSLWKMPRMRVKRRRRTVTGSAPVQAGSTLREQLPREISFRTDVVGFQLQSANWPQLPPVSEVGKTQSARPPEMFSAGAARALASLPRRPRRIWSGWIDQQTRSYRNMPIQLPTGEQAYIFGVRRGMCVYVREPDMCAGDPDQLYKTWGVLPARAIKVLKNPHAIVLGQLKAGTRERRYILKAASARRNGAMPVRRGARGRPRRVMMS